MGTKIAMTFGEASKRPICERRADLAAELYHKGIVDIVAVTGTETEKNRMLAQLLFRKVPYGSIITEGKSFDTVDNVLNLKETLRRDLHGISAIHIVTSQFHSLRTRLIVRSVFPDVERVTHVVHDQDIAGFHRYVLEQPLIALYLPRCLALKNDDYIRRGHVAKGLKSMAYER